MTEQILDFVKQDRDYYRAKAKPEIVETVENRYLTVDGQGKPDDAQYQGAIGALYTEIFSLKFFYKSSGKLFKVPKLETLWWVDEGKEFEEIPMEQWRWKLMFRIPEYVTLEQVKKSSTELQKKGKLREPYNFRIESISEGRCAHVMHIGPYDKIGNAYTQLEQYMKDLGVTRNGPYHEIYISDPTKTEPEKLKTIIRVPVK